MRFLGELKQRNEGVGSIIGAVFIILILLSGLTFYVTYLNITEQYSETAQSMGNLSLNQNQEKIVIKQISLTTNNNLNLTVENQGSVHSHLIWLGLFNKSAVPENQSYYALDESLNPSETRNIVSSFTVVRDLKYVVQLVTKLGNTVQNVFYPARAAQCALSLTAASPTTYAGNNVTLMLTVTLNDTEVDIVQNITASISVAPTDLVELVGNSSLTVTGLARGESAFFWWVYNTINTGTVTFNATYSSAPYGFYALTSVNVLAPPSQGGGSGSVTVSGVNGTAEYSPSHFNLLGETQNERGLVTALSANDNSYMIFRSFASGAAASINHFVDNSASNVDGPPNKGTQSNFSALKVGPDAIYNTLTEAGFTSTNTYNPSNYSLLGSTQLVSGTVANLQTNNGVYMNFRSYASGTSTNNFYPSGYSLLGSTSLVSGSLADLQSDNGVYMTTRSYVSATSSTSKTDAFIAYRSNTQSGLSFPKNRLWDGDTTVWGAENEMTTANSPVRFVRTAVCPKSERALEKIVVTLSDDGYLDAYVFDGTSWVATNNIAFPGTTANAYKCFDVAYEQTSGRAMLVYSRGTTTNEIGFRIWTFGSGWGSEQLLDLPYTTGIVYWISLAAAPGTRAGTADDNEIAMIYLDANVDAHGYVWTGSAWSLMGATAVWDATAAIATEECIAVAYEQVSGRAMFVWGDSVATDNYNRIWNGTTLSGPTLAPDIAAQGGLTNWITLKSNPSSNVIVFLVIDAGSDLNTAYWSGSAWTIHTEHDAAVDTHAQRCADFAWEPTGSKGLLVWGTTAGKIAYRTFTAPNTWGTQQNPAMGSLTHSWVQLRTNPRSISGDALILGAVMEGGTALDIGAIKWDGTTFTTIGTTTITSDTTVITYECFELEFQQFGDPTEFTNEVQFTGASNTQSWTQLTWTIDSSSTMANTNATAQLYNYQTGQYPTSGDGYLNGAIGTTDVTLSQNITTNPTYFRDGSGNWALKIKLVKATTQQFDWRCDLVRFTSTHPTEFTSEVEFTGTSNTDPWTQLAWTIDSSSTTTGITATFQLYNYVTGAYSTSGNGYMTDTIGTTDLTKTQTITVNPNQFKDVSGNWKLKVTGVKTTTSQFNWQGDLVAYMPSSVNYVLDLEVQWTNVDFSQTNKWLCIYGGIMAAENLHVDVWDGSAWQAIITPLSSGWNNVSVSSYLTSSTFTIRFTDASSDAVQDSWNIDVVLLHLWTMGNQYTAEVEFTGSTNLQNWTSLLWQIQSCWDTDQVTVNIQLYNFTLGAYAPSGNGYLSYISSATPNTNELQYKTENSNPNDFKNSTGHWRVKITGVKLTSTQFFMKIDWINLYTAYSATGNTIPFNAWQLYSIKATTTSGDPIPYAYVSIYATGTSIAFRNATDKTSIENPTATGVRLDASGTIQLEIKSASGVSETFSLYAVVGSEVGKKTVTQENPP